MANAAKCIDIFLEPPLFESASIACINVIVAKTASNRKINELKKSPLYSKIHKQNYIYILHYLVICCNDVLIICIKLVYLEYIITMFKMKGCAL